MSAVVMAGGRVLKFGSGGGVLLLSGSSPPPPSGSSDYKFIPGDYMLTRSYDFGVTMGGSGTNGYVDEINLLAAGYTGVAGYVATFISPYGQTTGGQTIAGFEDTTKTTNGALSASGLSGASLQSHILTQYPGFANIDTILNYLVAHVPGAVLGIYIKIFEQSPGSIGPTQLQQDWTSLANPWFPKWMTNLSGSSGVLTIPDYYGASTTNLYSGPVAPIYSGNSCYGFCFAGAGSGSYSALVSHFWNPPIAQVPVQMLQALALYQIQSGPYAGMTIDQCPAIAFVATNDEIAFNCSAGLYPSGGNATGMPFEVNPPYQGSTTYAASAAGAFIGYRQIMSGWAAALPHTVIGASYTFGFDGTTLESNSTLPPHFNELLSPFNGLTNIRGVACSGADMEANSFGLYNSTKAQANGCMQGFIGIAVGGAQPMNSPSVASKAGIAPYIAQMQDGDYRVELDGTGLTQLSPGVLTAICANAAVVQANWRLWTVTDEAWFGTNAWTGQYGTSAGTGPGGYVANWGANGGEGIYYAITNGLFSAISTLLPTGLMGAPQNFVAVTTSTTAVLTWTPKTSNTGTGLVYQIFRNGSLINTTASTSISTYTDTGLSANTSYTYTINVWNTNGAGPQSTWIALTAVFSYQSGFAGSSSQIYVVPNYGGLSGSTIVLINANSGHSDGGAWWKQLVAIANGFTSDFTFQITGATPTAGGPSIISGLTFVLQNDSRGATISGDANTCGYGAYEQNPGNIPIENSIGIKFDIGGGSYTNPPNGYFNSTGLFTNGGFAANLIPQQDLNPYGININLGNILAVKVVYDLTILTMTVRDTVTGAQARYSWPITINNFTGSSNGANMCYVGISCGQVANTQQNLLTWDYYTGYNPRLSTPTFSVTPGQYAGTQNVVLSGPSRRLDLLHHEWS